MEVHDDMSIIEARRRLAANPEQPCSDCGATPEDVADERVMEDSSRDWEEERQAEIERRRGLVREEVTP